MENGGIFLSTPINNRGKELYTLVENRTLYSLNNCEFNIFETHEEAYGVKLKFEDLSFTTMVKGKKVLKLEDKSNYFPYVSGESVLVSPGETMVIDFPEANQSPTQCIAISFNNDFIEKSLEYLNINQPKQDEESRWEVSNDFYHLFNNASMVAATNNIMRIAMEDNTHKDIMADFALKELLIRLMQTQARDMVEKNAFKKTSRIGFVVDYIKENLHQKLSVDAIAKVAYISKSGFFKMFKDELGISPNEYIVKERINKAKQLLKLNYTVKETAFQTGFTDTNYFTRVFKQWVGTTPKIFQEKGKLGL